jgi:hypothetical protein
MNHVPDKLISKGRPVIGAGLLVLISANPSMLSLRRVVFAAGKEKHSFNDGAAFDMLKVRRLKTRRGVMS